MIPKEIHYQLSFAQNQWICSNNTQQFMCEELSDIDESIYQSLKKTHEKGDFVIRFYFDTNAFPQWFRQYMPHYFNRQLILNIP